MLAMLSHKGLSHKASHYLYRMPLSYACRPAKSAIHAVHAAAAKAFLGQIAAIGAGGWWPPLSQDETVD
ncbi:MAG: hypothetical protein INF41_00750 [Rhodospirillaceae bacterium]|nr:hypothetical protein [Rhodospirillaceae bacterium]